VKKLGSGFKCYSNTHKLVSGPKVLCLNISIFQGPVGKAVVYILHAELVACTIMGDSEIQGVKLPGEKDGECIETKLCMFADDTQLFNKNDESVKISFDILTIYEKASCSKVNNENTKDMYIGSANITDLSVHK
jgi:hypothetical protein